MCSRGITEAEVPATIKKMAFDRTSNAKYGVSGSGYPGPQLVWIIDPTTDLISTLPRPQLIKISTRLGDFLCDITTFGCNI